MVPLSLLYHMSRAVQELEKTGAKAISIAVDSPTGPVELKEEKNYVMSKCVVGGLEKRTVILFTSFLSSFIYRSGRGTYQTPATCARGSTSERAHSGMWQDIAM